MSGLPNTAFGSFSIRGRAIAPGLACGPLRRNRAELAPEAVSGAILLAERAVPDDIARILASSGTLTLSATLLSHVSLLSREFGKPSVALAGITPARFAAQGEDGLLLLEDVVGAGVGAALDEGDIVFLDGGEGALHIPGGLDRDARRTVRRVFGALAAFSKLPSDENLARALLEESRHPGAREFLIDAVFTYRMLPSGPTVRGLLEAMGRGMPPRELQAMLERLRERVLSAAASRCETTRSILEASDGIEDVQRALRGLEEELARDRRWLEDLGEDTGRLDRQLEPVLAAAGARRIELEEAIRRDVQRALDLPDDLLRSRLGGLFRLLRRARAASLDADSVNRLQRRLARQLADERARAGSHLIVPLAPEAPCERALVGGKAQALIGMCGVLPEGCRIPKGFVLTSAAYRLHLLGETGEKLRLASHETDESAISRRARAAVLSGDVPDEALGSLKPAFDALGSVRVAVRSSATVEDGPRASFAGLFDTYLGVSSFDDLVDRIRWTWASLWNARALAALRSMGVSPLRVSQAVIVQEMIETRSAGVLFSRDPAGQPDTLLINAAWGLGEGISEGDVVGDVFWVRRSTGALIAAETGRTQKRIQLAPTGTGTVEVPLPAELHGRPCLTPEELARLAALARSVEEATGRAQDVEFGFDDNGGLVVFQMRRIVPHRME